MKCETEQLFIDEVLICTRPYTREYPLKKGDVVEESNVMCIVDYCGKNEHGTIVTKLISKENPIVTLGEPEVKEGLRDTFAGQIVTGLCASANKDFYNFTSKDIETAVDLAYNIADEMLKRRKIFPRPYK